MHAVGVGVLQQSGGTATEWGYCNREGIVAKLRRKPRGTCIVDFRCGSQQIVCSK